MSKRSKARPQTPDLKTLARRRIRPGCRGELSICLPALTYAGENTLTLRPELSARRFTPRERTLKVPAR